MPTNFVQSNTVNNAAVNSQALAFTGAVTPSNSLVMLMRLGAPIASLTPVTVSDSVNGNWTVVPHFPIDDAGPTNSLHAWYFQNTAAGTPTLTSSWQVGSNTTVRMLIGEVATSVLTGVIDNSNSQTFALNTSIGTPTIATTNAADLLISVFESNNGGGAPVTDSAAGSNPPSGWFNEADISAEKLYVSTVVVAASGSYLENWTLTNADNGASGIIAIKKASGGPVTSAFAFSTPGTHFTRKIATVAY